MTADHPSNNLTVLRNARREATMIMTLWLGCMIYTGVFCYTHGYLNHAPHAAPTGPSLGEIVGPLEQYNREPDTLIFPFSLGIPDWVFWGVVVPWLFCIVVTFWFCLVFFTEDDLCDDSGSPDAGEPDGQSGAVHV